MSEIPVHFRPRRLVDWINPTGARKVHSLVDKVYKRKNLEMAWEKVKANRGSGGVDGQTLETFEAQLEQQLQRLHRELKEDTYQPLPVRQHRIPKPGKPGEFRMLGIPAIYDRVCQQALLNRLEPIFEPIFDAASFGYRRGRSAKNADGHSAAYRSVSHDCRAKVRRMAGWSGSLIHAVRAPLAIHTLEHCSGFRHLSG
jgi:RNA-directed DNA polymerase